MRISAPVGAGAGVVDDAGLRAGAGEQGECGGCDADDLIHVNPQVCNL